MIPHSDGAGEIDMVGDGVPPARMGERVWIWNAQWKRAFGTCAEYVVLPAALAVPLPAHVGYEAGACLGIPAMTAYHAVAVAGAAKGRTVLVTGGAGGVGHYAIQFAKARGATVLTTVSSEAKAKLARAGRRRPCHRLQARERRRAGHGDHRQGRRRCRGRDGPRRQRQPLSRPAARAQRGRGLRHRQRQAAIPAQFLLVNAIAIQFVYVYELTAEERAAAIAAITRMLEDKTLINNVALTLPLDDIVAAHEAVEQGKAMGNVVVTL